MSDARSEGGALPAPETSLTTASRVILGLYQGYNANACLLVEGEPTVIVENERHTRVRHAYGSSAECVEDCLRGAGMTTVDVDRVGFCGASDLATDYGYDIPAPAGHGSFFPALAGTRLLSTDCFRESVIVLSSRGRQGVCILFPCVRVVSSPPAPPHPAKL